MGESLASSVLGQARLAWWSCPLLSSGIGCRCGGVSRQTLHTWLWRYQESRK